MGRFVSTLIRRIDLVGPSVVIAVAATTARPGRHLCMSESSPFVAFHGDLG